MNNHHIDWTPHNFREAMGEILLRFNLPADYLPNIQTGCGFIALQENGFPGKLMSLMQTLPDGSAGSFFYGVDLNGEILNLRGETFEDILDGRYSHKLRETPEGTTSEITETDQGDVFFFKRYHPELVKTAREGVSVWMSDYAAKKLDATTPVNDGVSRSGLRL